MAKVDCPSCNAKINLGPKPKMGQRMKCNECGADLEVVWLEPLELDFPFDEDEDFDDSDEEDYEEEAY